MTMLPVIPPDLELRASCDLLGTVPGGMPVKVTIGFARAFACHACGAAAGAAHEPACSWWAEHGMGLPQYAGSVGTGYQPLPTVTERSTP